MKRRKTGIILFFAMVLIIGSIIVINNIQESDNEKTTEIVLPNKEENLKSDLNDEGLSIGNLAPDFENVTLDGDKVKLSDYRGKKVMLNFWASWCPPCQEEMPDLQKLDKNYDDIEVVAVNLTNQENSLKAVDQFINEMGLDLIIPLDENGELMKLYRAIGIPTSYLIDTNGRIGNVFQGPIAYEQMVREFEKLD